MYHSFLINLTVDGHLSFFHVLAFINSAEMNIEGTRVSFNSGFLCVYAQQWDCWVIWQFYFQFFKEFPCVVDFKTVCIWDWMGVKMDSGVMIQDF